MILKKPLLILVFSLLPALIFADTVKIFGNAPEYANSKLCFKFFSDQITFTEEILAKCMVDSLGDFSVEFNLEETTYVFLHLGAYEAFLFVEPGKIYELLLPERKDKTITDELNPYFQPIQYHLGLNNISDQELNYQLAYLDEIYAYILNGSMIDSYNEIKEHNASSTLNKVDTVFSKKAYSRVVNNNSMVIYNNLKQINMDEQMHKLDSIFSDVDNKYFSDFKKYKIAAFRNAFFNEKMKSISNNYYLNEEILYNNNAYMSLFNQVYDEYFIYFGRTDSGKKIYNDINKLKSYSELDKTLQQDSILKNDTLRELVVLKCLFDEFYNDKFSRSAMLTILDTLFKKTVIPEHKSIAENIKNRVTKLMVGYKPPEFNLLDKDSNYVSLNDFEDKYVYLGFCTTVSYACIKEFEMLRNLYENHKDHFEIIMICMDETLPQMKHFVERKKYPFTFLYYGNQSEVFKDYDIRAFPTYYFIDRKGKLSISPAPSPGENAEYRIFQIMRSNGDI